MGKNDERIIQLKEAIVKKKEELSKTSKFVPVTNCSLKYKENLYNIHALPLDTALSLAIQLNSMRLSVEDLGYGTILLSGYDIKDWIKDIKSKIDLLKVKEEELKLRDMERKLDKLLSEEKKTELVIDEIAELLK